jgi:type I restriction enzyme S subunit
MKISDIADIINVTEKDPSTSGIDIFVGLEHYDIAEPVIKRYGSTKMLSTAAKKFEAGDVLIARRNVYLQRASVARFAGLTSGDSIVLRVKKNLNVKGTDYDSIRALLPFILNSINFWDYANTNADGTMSKRLSPAMLLDYEFNLPPISEQKVLADKLWAAYEVKQSYLKMIEATQEMVKSQFIEMFGGGNWTQKCLGEVGSFKRGGGFQKSDYVEHGIPCIHYGQIHTLFGAFIFSHITEISSDLESKTKFASKGDLIIAITSEDAEGSCKSTAWLGDYPVAVGGHAAIFHHCMNPLYMSFFFKSTLFNHAKMEYIHGTKVFEIRPDDIAKILVPCPPISLQEQFSAIAEQADKSEVELRKSIDAIDNVIKSLINENI